jgi:hypothetical protein
MPNLAMTPSKIKLATALLITVTIPLQEQRLRCSMLEESSHLGDSIGKSTLINSRFGIISNERDIRMLNENSRRSIAAFKKCRCWVDDEEKQKCDEGEDESALSDYIARASWIPILIHRDTAYISNVKHDSEEIGGVRTVGVME